MKSKVKSQKLKAKSSSQKLKFLLLTCTFAFLFLPFNLICYAQPLSSTELINNAKNYNGNTVVYKGEVIGDIMLRGEYAWVNVNDGQNAIGIWVKKELIKDILYTGSYTSKGDILEITGKFNRSCPEHGGDLDIHAQSIIIISSGSKISHSVNRKEINFILGLFSIIAVVSLFRLIKKT
jgi:hypothetical protein